MPLCGSTACGCSLSSSAATSAAIGGYYPTISASGAGTPASPWVMALDSNWAGEVAARLDGAYGIEICTSGTRPSTPVEGQKIYETDTDRELTYDGSAWVVTDSPWASYTPTLTNASNGNGTLNFVYRYAGWKTVHVRGTWTLGSTSSVTGLIGFSYPDSTTPDSSPRSIGHAWIENADGADFIGTCQAASSIFVYSAGITSTSASSPFTWSTSDQLSVDIIFEIT